MFKTNRMWKGLLVALLVTSGVLIACQKDAKNPDVTSAAKGGVATPSTQYAVPTLSCVNSSTQFSIDLTVTAGGTGAPSGFSIQWMTKAAFDALGGVWPLYTAANTDANGDPISASFCKASFSGNANLSKYNLGPNQSVTVTIGDLLLDNGASTTCPDELVCGTDYVFRVFAHGDSKMNRSAFSVPNICSTLACDNSCGRHGYGYWRNHCDEITSSLQLGANTYLPQDLCDILHENPSPGNGLLIVAHHLIAAKLNGLTSPTTDAADNYIGSNLLPTSTNGSTAFQKANTAAGYISTLRNFNETCSPAPQP